METAASVGIKRKSTLASQIKSSKRKRLQGPQLNILDLSDCTLLHVLQFLDATSLYQLGETCTRFKYLVQDESLWIHVDGRAQPINVDKLAFCWQNVHKKTKCVLLAGTQRAELAISLEILIGSDKLSHLTVLALEYQCIKYCKLVQFPNTLQELSFKHSYIPRHAQFFRFSEASMSNLKTLILDHCLWFEAGSLTSFCKYPKLEVLSLYMCKKLSEDDIGSISLAGKFGFKSLRVVDLRFTGVGDLFIKTFYANPSVQVIYFQCFATTYYLERYKRKLDLVDGLRVPERAYISDDEANNDTSKRSLNKRFKAVRLQRYSTYTIKDESMVVFSRLKKTGVSKARPKSYLYAFPYDECTCGFFDRTSDSCRLADSTKQDPSSEEELSDNLSTCSKDSSSKSSLHRIRKPQCDSSSNSESSGDENDWDPKRLQRKLDREIKKQKRNRHSRRGGNLYFMCPNSTHICGKILFDSCTIPDWCQVEANLKDCCRQKWMYTREPRNDYEIAMLEHTDKHLQARVLRGCGTENSDCDCTSSGEGDRGTVIIIARNPDGSMINFSTYDRTTPENNSVRFPLSDSIKYLIKKTCECIEQLKAHEFPENIAMDAVNEFLNAVDECLEKEEMCQFFADAEFIRQLCVSFFLLARHIKHNTYYVLNYHFLCFEDLLKQLVKKTSVSVKKQLLMRFFNNMLCSESMLPFHQANCIATHNWMASDIPDENWNRPGPSGLQFPPRMKSFNLKDKSTERGDSKDDSDSDTSTEFPSKDKSERDSCPSSNSEERNGVDKANARNALSSYIVSKKKDQLLNTDSDTDDDPDNINLLKYLVYNMPSREGNVLDQPPIVIRPDVIEIENMVVHVVSAPPGRDIPTNIKELSFRGFPHVTDRTLMLLKELELELLDVTGTSVTQLGVQQFMLYNPKCRVIHEAACVCRPKLHF